MNCENAKGSNSNGAQKSQTQDGLVPAIQIFITNNQLSWKWHGITGEQVEQILLDAFRGQVKYNLDKAQKKSAILKPGIGDIIAVNK